MDREWTINVTTREPATISTVNIRPGVGVLSVISFIRYQPWFALAELVDNAIQSYLTNQTALRAVDGAQYKLRVEIEVEHDKIVIRDNAGGISQGEYGRAFRPAALPTDRSGLNQFGMGMKTAACWFARKWQVRTTALGESIERTVRFDVEHIVSQGIEELDIEEKNASANWHFTEVILSSLNHTLYGKTLAKVKEHLSSIYRAFLRRGDLELIIANERLEFKEFRVLEAPFHFRPNEIEDPAVRRWHKEIDFNFGDNLWVTGFAALRETGSTTHAGFALFRRQRVIQGSGDETYRPPLIFKGPNSFVSLRLSGELHLEGFEVSHTKDGFRWDGQEEAFLELLREHLDSDELPLLRQAENLRKRPSADDVRLKRVATETTDRAAAIVERDVPEIVERQAQRAHSVTPPTFEPTLELPIAQREIDVTVFNQQWRVRLEQSTDPGITDWLSILDTRREPSVTSPSGEQRYLVVRIALAHPFMMQFTGAKAEHLEPILRIAVALGLSEIAARSGGSQNVSDVRRNLNELLREALWK